VIHPGPGGRVEIVCTGKQMGLETKREELFLRA